MVPNRSATYRKALGGSRLPVIGAQPKEQLVLTDGVGRKIEDGLTMQLELIAREGALNALGLRQPRRDAWLRVGLRPIDGEPVATRFLRLVHGEIGRRQDLDARESVEQRDTDTGRDRNLMFGQHRRLAAERLHHAVRDHLGLRGIDLGQDDPELVTAQPCQDVRFADPVPQGRGDGLEEVVTRFVAEPVVDGFEVIQIEQEHRPAAAIAGRGLGLLSQRLLEVPAVEQRRQKIVIDEVLQPPFELFALGDVLYLRDDVQRSALVLTNERHAQQHPDRMTPGVAVSLLDLILLDETVAQLPHLKHINVDIVRIRQVVERASVNLRSAVPGNPTQCVVHAQQPAAHVHEGHADRRVRECVFKSATHRATRGLSEPVWGDRQRRIPPQTPVFRIEQARTDR